MSFFLHPNAIVEPGAEIGSNTRVWAFVHILPGASIGSDCNICDHVFIENDVILGDRVTIKSGVQLWNGIRIEDDVFVGPNATFTNDIFPRSKVYPKELLKTLVCEGASIGANATLLPGIVVGKHAMVGAGAVVTTNVPPNAIVVGNPSRITGYVDTHQKPLSPSPTSITYEDSIVPGTKLLKFPEVFDIRGSLTFGEYQTHLPFHPKRFFVISNVPTREVRGEHAHKKLEQLLICLKGSVCVVVDHQNLGLYIPAMTWAIQYKYSDDAILLVLASDVYDSSDYIRDYDEYLRIVRLGHSE